MIEADFKKLNFSILGEHSQLEGDLKFEGDTLINCHVKGTITIIDQGKLTLERSAKVEGEIYCHDIEVFGEFRGTLNSSGVLTVRSSGVLSGRINAQNMSVYPGAQINMEGHTHPESEQTSKTTEAPTNL